MFGSHLRSPLATFFGMSRASLNRGTSRQLAIHRQLPVSGSVPGTWQTVSKVGILMRPGILPTLMFPIWMMSVCLAAADEGPTPPDAADPRQQRLAERDQQSAAATTFRIEGQLPEARASEQRALAIEQEVFGRSHDEVADRLESLASLEQQAGDFKAAREWLRQATEMYSQLHGESHYTVARVRQWAQQVAQLEQLTAEQFARYDASSKAWMIGKRSAKQGRWDDAAAQIQQAADTRRELFGEANLGYLFCLVELSVCYSQQGRFADAEQSLLKATALSQTMLTESDPLRASILFSLGFNYLQNDDPEKAEQPLRQALELRRQLLGEQHPHTGFGHTALGHVLRALYRYGESETEFRAALAIAEQQYGPDHFEVGVCEGNLAGLLILQERSVEADKLLSSATRKMEQHAPGDERRYIDILSERALLLDQMGRYREALEVCERVTALARTAYGVDHPDYPAVLFMHSDALRSAGRYDEAQQLLEEVRDWYRKHEGERSQMYGYVLRRLAQAAHDRNRFQESDRSMDAALQVLQATEGDTGAGVVVGWKLWADMCAERGEFERAEQNYQKALHLSADNPRLTFFRTGASTGLALMLADLSRWDEAVQQQRTAIAALQRLSGMRIAQADSLRVLAGIYASAGRIADAEKTHRESLALCEASVGREHPRYAVAETSYARFLAEVGRYTEADSLTRHALEIEARTHGTAHREYAGALACAAGISLDTGRSEEAVQLLTQALDIQRASVGERNQQIATIQHNLGCAYLDLHQFRQATEHLNAATELVAELNGKSHPRYGISLTALGRTQQEQGQYADAERLFKQSADIHLAAAGEDDPHYINALSLIASVKLATDRTSEGIAALDRVMQLQQKRLQQVAGFSDEASLRAFELHVRRSLRALTSVATRPNAAPDVQQLAADWVLRRKGIVFAALCRFRDQQRLSASDSETRRLVEREHALRQRISSLALKPPADMAQADLTQLSRTLSAEADRLQADVHRRLTDLRGAPLEPETIDWRTVADRLPADAALVDFVRLYAYDPTAINGQPTWLPAHYYALVLRGGPQSSPQLFDLGPAEPIEAAVHDLRKHLQDTPRLIPVSGEAFLESQYRSLSRRVHDLAWRPLSAALDNAITIYVAPDSELNRIAFETLNDESGAYLAERYQFAYLTSGRELLRSDTQSGQGTVIFAGPDFDVDEAGRRTATADLAARLPTPSPALQATTDPGAVTGLVLRGGAWKALAGAAAEADDVTPLLDKSVYGPVTQYVGAQAQEELLKHLSPPRILHVATHGYFVEDEPEAAVQPGEYTTRGRLFGSAVGFERLRASQNPLLRSGIVLAGANRIAERSQASAPSSAPGATAAEATTMDDGWLTAEEIATLDLRGTELVVLSACETGLGDVPTGEGVQGLRRAFLYAGARTLVTSLYKVPDDTTRPLMREFYSRLTAGADQLTALHEARLAEMRRRRASTGAAHPFFWGSFILVGNPQRGSAN